MPKDGATGVIVTQGGSAGGWTLYAHEGRLKYCYYYFGIEHYMAEATKKFPAGAHQVRMEFTYDGGGIGKGGDVTLYYDGKAVGKGRVDKTQPMAFSADEACDVGFGHRLAGFAGLWAHRQQVHRRDRVGADRPRRGQPRPPDHRGGPLQHRYGQAVTAASA